MDTKEFQWTREPKKYSVKEQRIEITTEPHTDLTSAGSLCIWTWITG